MKHPPESLRAFPLLLGEGDDASGLAKPAPRRRRPEAALRYTPEARRLQQEQQRRTSVMKQVQDAYIVAATRTPIGKSPYR